MNVIFVTNLTESFALIWIAYLDLRDRYIPDRYMLLLASIVLATSAYSRSQVGQLQTQELLQLLLPAALTALPFVLLYILRDDIGGADAKLAAIIGLKAGLVPGLRLLLLSSILSLVGFGLHHLWRVAGHRIKRCPATLVIGGEDAYHYPLLPAMCLALLLMNLNLLPQSFLIG